MLSFRANSPSTVAPPVAIFEGPLSTVARAWACGYGLRKPTPASRSPRAWQEDIVATLEPNQRAIVARCVFFLGKARTLASGGEMEESCRIFGQARLISRQPELGRKARLLCVAELEPAEAYLDFVCHDLHSAEHRLVQAMEADQSLEDEFGHTSLHVHRVHLANNLVKVRAKNGSLVEALDLASKILQYVGACSNGLPVPTSWSAARRDAMTPEARSFLLRQTTFEIACALAGVPPTRWAEASL